MAGKPRCFEMRAKVPHRPGAGVRAVDENDGRHDQTSLCRMRAGQGAGANGSLAWVAIKGLIDGASGLT
ncbi:MAG: hypothetical protein MnENMB40S_34250 [Rhizobiaceae bacterium MnEN-MB40S]|nr:MAG: hypothetical protein MnENMB40S_34250 [Rhizobiaceae bacterium MnEN-MB40S]